VVFVGFIGIEGIKDIVGFGTAACDYLYVFMFAGKWVDEVIGFVKCPSCDRVLDFIDIKSTNCID